MDFELSGRNKAQPRVQNTGRLFMPTGAWANVSRSPRNKLTAAFLNALATMMQELRYTSVNHAALSPLPYAVISNCSYILPLMAMSLVYQTFKLDWS